jgi:hypothetical protein
MPRIRLKQVKGRKTHPNWTGIMDEVKRTIRNKTKPELKKRFMRRTANWRNKPTYWGYKVETANTYGVWIRPVGANKMLWMWVSLGTKPHVIRPKFAKSLAFPSASFPKTMAGDVFGLPGGSYGTTVFAGEVQHPGNEPRGFEKGIAKEYEPIFIRDMESAMRRGANKA